MAFLSITSDNDRLSYVISKNPSSGVFMRECHNGVVFGWFTPDSQNQYNAYFKDGSDMVSYKSAHGEQFEYLSASRYNDARFINDAIQNLFLTARDKELEDDVPSNHTIKVMLVGTPRKTIDTFQRYFKGIGITISSEEVLRDNHTVQFIGTGVTLNKLLKYMNLFSMFAVLDSDTVVRIMEDQINKYIWLANELDAPYFIRYIMKVKMIRSPQKFEATKSELEKSKRYEIKLGYGDTHTMRIDWIKGLVQFHTPIIDLGAGKEHRYIRTLGAKMQLNKQKYYAIERDEEAREVIKNGVRNRGLEDTVEIYGSFQELLDSGYNTEESVDVLCTEVLEHNNYEEAKEIVRDIFDKLNLNRLIVTVPNKGFNEHYDMTGEFRHDDHKWEGDEETVRGLVPAGVEYTLCGVGDSVDGVYVSWGLIMIK